MKKGNKWLKISYKIVKVIVSITLLLILSVVLIQKVSKNNLAIGGIRIFSIASSSMEPKYKVGDILVVKEFSADNLEIGDSVTYLGKEADLKGLVITHEIIEKREENGKYYFVTQGIANEYTDPEISEDDIYGKIVYETVVFSFFGRLMTHMIVYYVLFAVVGVSISYQVIKVFFFSEDDGEEDEKTGTHE